MNPLDRYRNTESAMTSVMQGATPMTPEEVQRYLESCNNSPGPCAIPPTRINTPAPVYEKKNITLYEWKYTLICETKKIKVEGNDMMVINGGNTLIRVDNIVPIRPFGSFPLWSNDGHSVIKPGTTVTICFCQQVECECKINEDGSPACDDDGKAIWLGPRNEAIILCKINCDPDTQAIYNQYNNHG